MRGLFKNFTLSSSHIISKQDKKKYNCTLATQASSTCNGTLNTQTTGSGTLLDMKRDYHLCHLNNGAKVIRDGKESQFFIYEKFIVPCLKNFNPEVYKRVFVNSGAKVPILRGSDVMAPGIALYREKCQDFGRNEIVGIEIIGEGLVAVGITKMSLEETCRETGIAVEVIHVINDDLNLERF